MLFCRASGAASSRTDAVGLRRGARRRHTAPPWRCSARPTVIQAIDPHYDTMQTGLFGPVLTIHVYDDKRYDTALELGASTSSYALTGAIFGTDRTAIAQATDALRFAAGNFYVNDKPTGAIVGQQPFGGSRMLGTNDKAGSILNLYRWVSPRTIKETFVPPHDWRYPFLAR